MARHNGVNLEQSLFSNEHAFVWSHLNKERGMNHEKGFLVRSAALQHVAKHAPQKLINPLDGLGKSSLVADLK